MYKRVFVPLMLINNNVYTFVSGILISLSINIFTNLCFAKSSLYTNWFLYLATIVFLLASALCMYIAAKISGFQSYIAVKRYTEYKDKETIVLDATKSKEKKWIRTYLFTVFMVISGVVLLVFNFIGN